MQIKNVQNRSGRRSALFFFAVTAAVAFPLSAEAQRSPPPSIEIPFAPPDLEVAVSSPAFIAAESLAWVDITVSNTLTAVQNTRFGSIMGGSGVNGVDMIVYFGGLRVVSVETAGGFQCPMPAAGVATQVTCTQGTIPAGGNVTIRVLVAENVADPYYCGLVASTALVDPFGEIAERSEVNNNPPPTMMQVSCIN
jgi:hypothetical protein